MKKISIIFLLTCLFLFQCTSQSTNPENETELDLKLGKLSLNLNISDAPKEVIKMLGMLSAENQDTIYFDFEISEEKAIANIENLTPGIWNLQVDAYNYNDNIIYTGTTEVKVESGITTIVSLHLNATTGSLEILVTWEDLTVTDIDGNVYKTIRIGDQVWMAENLKVTRYQNGDAITDGAEIGDYSEEVEPQYYFVYNDDENNAATYGRLYTWYVVADPRNISPAGWHVPSDEEFKELEMFLGLSESNTELVCTLENDISGKMKEIGITHWDSPNTGATNESGFNALPGGYRRRYENGFDYLGHFACFWSSTERDEIRSWYRHLYSDKAGICRTYNLKNYGFSIRCIKD